MPPLPLKPDPLESCPSHACQFVTRTWISSMYLPYPSLFVLLSHNPLFFPHQILPLRLKCLILNNHLPAQPSSFSWSNWSNSLRLSSLRMEGRPTGSTRRIGGPEPRGPTTRGKRLCVKQQMGEGVKDGMVYNHIQDGASWLEYHPFPSRLPPPTTTNPDLGSLTWAHQEWGIGKAPGVRRAEGTGDMGDTSAKGPNSSCSEAQSNSLPAP